MQLNDYVAENMPQQYRALHDFESGAGWVNILNRLLKKLEINGYYNITKTKERGVEVDNDYWITLPSDCRELIKVYDPDSPNIYYKWKYLNGKVKIDLKIAKDSDPGTFTLSAGTTTTVKINDADASADLWNEYLLILTNGTYSGNGIIIHDTAAAAGGTSTLTFRHTQPGSIDSTTGHLTNSYVVIEYRSIFAPISAYDDEIPIDDRYEGDLLLYWFIMNSVSVTDKSYKVYRALFDEAWDEMIDEQCTPSPDNLRPDPTPWPKEDAGYGVLSDQYVQDKEWDD